MAVKLTDIPSNLTEYPNSFKRQSAFPLEAYSLFYSAAAAKDYAANNPIAYVGQLIGIIENDIVAYYKIMDTSGTLKQLMDEENNSWGSF